MKLYSFIIVFIFGAWITKRTYLMAKFVLSAIADDISPDLSEQVRTLKDLNLGYIDLRSVDGKQVRDFTDKDVGRIRELLRRNDIRVSCIGSSVGHSSIDTSFYEGLAELARVIEIGKALGTHRIRIFGSCPPENIPSADYDEYLDRSLRHMERFITLAQRENVILLLENQRQTVVDTVARCYRLIRSLSGPHFRFLWDPANFVRVGEGRITEDGWDLLGSEVGYVHIRDALLADGRVVAAGEGDGQVRELLERLQAANYNGFLALEPHPDQTGLERTLSGHEEMASAVQSLRRLMASLGIEEAWDFELMAETIPVG
jgi:sugar phosphate isomerase/epimerase